MLRDTDGAYVNWPRRAPEWEARLFALAFPNLPPVYAEMDGEVRPPVCYHNFKDAAGPAWSQIATQDEDEDEREE